jgi:nucleotide-binding universal stress UspA family protein
MSEQPHQPPLAGERPRIVVGVDGSPDSLAALRAGAWAAAARGGSLTAVLAWGAPMTTSEAMLMLPDLHEEAQQRLHDAIREALGEHPLVPVGSIVTSETTTAALVQASEGADLLVVGTRGHGGFAGLLVGSVSMACTMHARCPVLVVHDGSALTDGQEARNGARVLVGVGDSIASVTVLRAAARIADELDAELLAVRAWLAPPTLPGSRPELHDEARATATHALARQVDAAFPDGRPSRLRMEIRQGTPAAVLVEGSRTADVVVVGRRGRSRWSAALLGSVSLPVAAHAGCPVLVVPDESRGVETVPAKVPVAAGDRA